MKNQILLFTLMLSTLMANAHGIEVQNVDGKTIYYNYTNNGTELEVSFRGSVYSQYANEYQGNVVIPEEVTVGNITRKVTSIGNGAFEDCSDLTSVTIPNSVKSIEGYAFAECSGITSITIPNSLTSIGYYAFAGCSNLTSVTIPNSVTSIGIYAFYDCFIKDFINNSNLDAETNMYWGANIIDTRDNGFIIKDGSLIKYTGNERSVTIPNSVTSIGDGAFSNCSGLTSVTIGNSVTSIGDGAFSNCLGLTSVTIPNSVTSIGKSAFSGCSGLISVTISNSVTSIGSYGFSDCSKITSIFIPASVQEIGGFAFNNCCNLKTVIFEDGARELEFTTRTNSYLVDTFNECQLEKVYLGRTMYFWPLNMSPFRTCSVDSVIIGANIQSSDTYRKCYDFFNDCKYLEIKKKVTSVPNDFSKYSNLTKIIVEEGNSVYDSRNNCNAIIRTSDNTLCVGCKNTVIPNNIESIGDLSFHGCTGLSSITIPYNVKHIGKSAFYGCEDLSYVQIPQNVDLIDDLAFAACKKLETVVCLGVPNTFALKIFDGVDLSKSQLFVSEFCMNTFRQVAPWNSFGSIIALQQYHLFYYVDDLVYKLYNVEEGMMITPEPTPTKEGYTFSGWSEIPATMPAKDVTVTGTFSVNSYKLTYMVDDKEYKSYDVEYGSTITPETAPTKEGYTFSGWSEIPATMPAKDVTVTGSFTVNSYKLTYMVDGEEYKSFNVVYGSTITPESEPKKEGYIFSGWSEIPETMPAKDVVVTGTFTLDTTGIDDVYSNDDNKEYYDLNGVRIVQPNKGINIIKMSDGSIKKVFIK